MSSKEAIINQLLRLPAEVQLLIMEHMTRHAQPYPLPRSFHRDPQNPSWIMEVGKEFRIPDIARKNLDLAMEARRFLFKNNVFEIVEEELSQSRTFLPAISS